MDVCFVRSPLPLVAAQREDVLLASHQNNAASGNIGVYSVRANDGTREFFEDCLDFQRRKPDEHDQRIFNNLLALSKYVARGAQPPRDWKDCPPTPRATHPVTSAFVGPHVIVDSFFSSGPRAVANHVVSPSAVSSSWPG